MISFMEEAASVHPSRRQQSWYALGAYAFIHFGPNTYTDREWGDGREPESIFDPAELDCDQWVAAIKSAGLKGMILTAKHHDGFCLWPSAFTEHSVKNSPHSVDVVKAAAEACRRGGIRFGFYLSPWDRNSPLYGTEAYNDYFCSQLQELLTGYGDIFCVWFDNACGEGPNGKKQIYDFPRYFDLIRKYQPEAVIFNDFGPDVRWCGNEAGTCRHAEWAVVPSELCRYSEIQTGPGPLAGQGDLSYLYNTDDAIGDLPHILYSRGLTFTPAEVDVSIRPGWFWHPQEEPHDLQKLLQIWIASVGSNACLNLNVPPNRKGLLDERDVTRLREFGALLRRTFGTPIPCEIEKSGPDTQPEFTLTFAGREPQYLVLSEDLTRGQRVEAFRVSVTGELLPCYEGTCIGNRKICPLRDPFAGQNPLTAENRQPGGSLTLRITAARGPVHLKELQIF